MTRQFQFKSIKLKPIQRDIKGRMSKIVLKNNNIASCEDGIQLSTKSYFKDDLTSAINRLLVLNPNVIFNEED